MSIRLLDTAPVAKERRSPHRVDEASGEKAIVVSGLRKTYPGGVEAVKGVSFDVEQGEVFGLVGPNGAGKSTTIGMLTSTVIPDEGSARLAGIDVATNPIAARRVSSVVFQDPVVDRALSGRANLMLHARLWDVPTGDARTRIDDLVESFGLADIIGRPVSTYSGGQRRRLEIARALVSEPRVLFLDEPTVGLDPRIRYELLDVIAALRDQAGVTILLTTHYLDEAERLCDRVAVMHDGRVVALDTPSALLAELGDEVMEMRVDGDVEHALGELRRRGVAVDGAYTIGSTVTVPLHGAPASEILANRAPTQESYVGALPAIAIVPWFFAGSLFPITTLPSWLSEIAKVLPLTHALALIRYGFLDPHGTGLHDIWGMSNTTEMAALSLGVVALFAVAMTALSIRIFNRSVLQ